MKRYIIPLIFLVLAFTATAQTMRTVNNTNEMVLLNPRTINSNLFVHVMPPLKGSVWTWIEGDTTGPDTNHLDSVLYPGLGRWVWNNIGTNYFETLIVSNLVAGGDSQWTNKGGILQPVNLTLPLLWTNRLSLSEGQTNLIYRSANRLVYSNDIPMLRLEGTGGTFDISWNLNTANMLASGGNNIALGSPLMTGDVFPGTDNTYNLGRRTAYGYWKDFYQKGTNCLTWYDSVPSTNWVAMETYMLGSKAIFNVVSQTNGVNGPVTGLEIQTNGVTLLTITGTGGPSSAANWTAVGATDSSLAGTATATNGYITAEGGTIAFTNDVKLVRDTANTLALRNGTSAQQFSIYDTWTDASNFRNATMGWQKTANAFVITTTNAGTALGTGGSIVLAPLGTAALTVGTNGSVTAPLIYATSEVGFTFPGMTDNHYMHIYKVDADTTALGRSDNAAGALQFYFRRSSGPLAPNGMYLGNTDTLITRDSSGVMSVTSGLRLTSTGSYLLSAGADTVSMRNAAQSGYATLQVGGIQGGTTRVLTNSALSDFCWISIPNTNAIGGKIVWTLTSTDGTDTQQITGETKFGAVAKLTAVTATLADVQCPAAIAGGGTLTAVVASNTTTNNVLALGVTPTSSLTTTNILFKWRLETPSTYTVNAL